jgi:pyridine nucleotide-disulfide oxidoreductase family protein
MTPGILPQYDIVLAGAGHTHLHVLRQWRTAPLPGARLTCVSSHPVAAYSGMLPGVLAGHYRPEEMEIDLVRLCAAVGARLIVGWVEGVDPKGRTLRIEGRPPLPFDRLSIGIGSTPSLRAAVESGAQLVALKPMPTLLSRLDAALESVRETSNGRLVNVAVVGGGAAGIEVALCLPAYLRQCLGRGVPVQVTLVSAGDILGGEPARFRRRVRQAAAHRGIHVITGHRVVTVRRKACTLAAGTDLDADLVLWATEASAPPLLERTGLPLDDRGFLLTDSTLRSLGDPSVFGVGDAGTIQGAPTPKAGVYAVRQGPVLWENLRRSIEGRAPTTYAPQHRFLKLIETGDGRALGEWRGAVFGGRWAWRLKRAIDRRFVSKYQDARAGGKRGPRVRFPPSTAR